MASDLGYMENACVEFQYRISGPGYLTMFLVYSWGVEFGWGLSGDLGTGWHLYRDQMDISGSPQVSSTRSPM